MDCAGSFEPEGAKDESLMSELILMKFIVGQRVVKEGEDSRFEGRVAEKERALISERTKAGLAAAKERGTRLGNPGLAVTREVRITRRKAWFADQAARIDGVIAGATVRLTPWREPSMRPELLHLRVVLGTRRRLKHFCATRVISA
jgi:hypothetical protein